MRSSGLVLFACAGLLLSGSAILGGSATWGLIRMSYYFWTTDLGVELGAISMFIAGAMLCLPTCWLATIVPYHTKSISLNATLIAVSMASLLLLSVGVSSVSALSHALREPRALNASMQRAMAHVSFDPTVRTSFSAMQIELKCCGVQSSSDWYMYRSSLPPACCGRLWNGKGSDHCGSPIYSLGCLRPALCELRNFVNTVTVLASALIIVMAVTLFAGAYSLAMEVVERAKPQPMRVACVPPPPQFLQAQPHLLQAQPHLLQAQPPAPRISYTLV